MVLGSPAEPFDATILYHNTAAAAAGKQGGYIFFLEGAEALSARFRRGRCAFSSGRARRRHTTKRRNARPPSKKSCGKRRRAVSRSLKGAGFNASVADAGKQRFKILRHDIRHVRADRVGLFVVLAVGGNPVVVDIRQRRVEDEIVGRDDVAGHVVGQTEDQQILVTGAEGFAVARRDLHKRLGVLGARVVRVGVEIARDLFEQAAVDELGEHLARRQDNGLRPRAVLLIEFHVAHFSGGAQGEIVLHHAEIRLREGGERIAEQLAGAQAAILVLVIDRHGVGERGGHQRQIAEALGRLAQAGGDILDVDARVDDSQRRDGAEQEVVERGLKGRGRKVELRHELELVVDAERQLADALAGDLRDDPELVAVVSRNKGVGVFVLLGGANQAADRADKEREVGVSLFFKVVRQRREVVGARRRVGAIQRFDVRRQVNQHDLALICVVGDKAEARQDIGVVRHIRITGVLDQRAGILRLIPRVGVADEEGAVGAGVEGGDGRVLDGRGDLLHVLRILGVEQKLAPHAEGIDHGVIVVAHDMNLADVVFMGENREAVAHLIDGRAAHADGLNGDQQHAAAARIVVKVHRAGIGRVDVAETGLVVAVAGHPVIAFRQRIDRERIAERRNGVRLSVGAESRLERRQLGGDVGRIGRVVGVKGRGIGNHRRRVKRRVKRDNAVQEGFERRLQLLARRLGIRRIGRIDGGVSVHCRPDCAGQVAHVK